MNWRFGGEYYLDLPRFDRQFLPLNDFNHEVEMTIHNHSINLYWRLAPKPLKRYDPLRHVLKMDKEAHKQRIRLLTIRARGRHVNL